MGSSYEKRYKGREGEIKSRLEDGLTIGEMQSEYGMATYDRALEFAVKLTGNPNIAAHNANRPSSARDAAALLAVEILNLVFRLQEENSSLRKRLEDETSRSINEDRDIRLKLEGLRSLMNTSVN